MTAYESDRKQIHLRISTEQHEAIEAVRVPGLNNFNSKAEYVIALGLKQLSKL